MMRDWNDIIMNDNFNEFLYNNKNILCNNRIIFNKKFLSLGLWYVSDMFVNNRLLDFEVCKNRGLSWCDYFKIVNYIKKDSVISDKERSVF